MHLLHTRVVIQHFYHLFRLFFSHRHAHLIATLQDPFGCELPQILVQILEPLLLKLQQRLPGIPGEKLNEVFEQDVAVLRDFEVVPEELLVSLDEFAAIVG